MEYELAKLENRTCKKRFDPLSLVSIRPEGARRAGKDLALLFKKEGLNRIRTRILPFTV